MDRRKLLAASLAAAFGGLTGLFAYAASLHPTPLAIADIGADDLGRYVEVRGAVRDSDSTRSGGGSLELLDLDSFASVRVFISAAAWGRLADRSAFVPGAFVWAVGELEAFGSEVVLQVSGTEGLLVLQAAGGTRVPLRTAASRAHDLLGMTVTVRAVLADPVPTVDPLRVRLRAGGSDIWAFAPDAPEGLLDLCGTVERDPLADRWSLLVAPGDAHPHPAALDCPPVPLAAVAADPAHFEGEVLGLVGVTAARGETLGTAFLLKDGAASLAGFIRSPALPPSLAAGDLVDFTAVVEFRASEGRYRLGGEASGLRAAA